MHTPTIFQPLAQSDAERDRVLVERTGSLIGLLDEHGSLLRINPTAKCVLGNIAADAPTEVMRALFHPDDLPALRNQWQELLNSGATLLTYRKRAEDGTWRWLETHATCTKHDDQRYVIAAVGHDVTDRKRAEDECQRSATRTAQSAHDRAW